MAARSPNVGRRKPPSLKCRLTAPAKFSKHRASRLALISSFSSKMVDAEDKGRPLHKIGATPNVRAKQPPAVAKALTTPRNRKPISNPDTFRSVGNPKPKNLVVPKTRVVAKALVFHSPNKAVRTKASSERRSPMGKICSAIKKLEITSGKKHLLGYNKPLPLNTSSKQFRGARVKTRVFDSLQNNRKDPEAKSLKKKNKEKDLKHCGDPVSHEGVHDNDSSDMEVDEKSRNGTLEGFSVSGKRSRLAGDEECPETGKTSEPSLGEGQVEVLSETSEGETISLSSSEKRDSEEIDDKENADTGNCREETTKLCSEKENTVERLDDEDDKENALANNKENDIKDFESDDKENIRASDDNRDLNVYGHSKRINLGKHAAAKNSQKVNQADKVRKESSTSAATNSQGVKSRKPKSTNLLGMTKEANMEKKVPEPERGMLKEITLVRLPGAKPINKHQNVLLENDTQGGCEKRLDRRTRLDENGSGGAKKTSKGDLEGQLCVVTPKRCNVSTYQKASPVTPHTEPGQGRVLKPEKERTKSPMVRQKLGRPRRVDSSRKKAKGSSKTPCRLSVIKETSSTKIRPEKAVKPCSASPATKDSAHTPSRSCSASLAIKDSARTPSRSLLRGRRPANVPKEPHF